MAGQVSFTMYNGPRHFRLTDADNANASLFITSSADWRYQADGFDIRMFASRDQLRQLRDLLNRADLDDAEYDIAYAATVRAWEAIGVS